MLNATVLITPLEPASAAVELKMPDNIQVDNIGNVVFTWTDPTEDVLAKVAAALSESPEQHKNRAAAYAVTVDPGGAYVRVQWSEIDPWTHTMRAMMRDGALVAATHVVDVKQEGVRLVLYRADAVFIRGTGEVFTGDIMIM